MRALPIPRRTFLRGAGAAVALPLLDSMLPAARAARAVAPRRVAFVFLPNGVHIPDWTPAEAGPGYALPHLLEPLAPVREHVLVVTGLAHDAARAHGDGPGDHARSAAAFLTGAHPVKTSGAGFRAGVSVDQVIARAVGSGTRFPSLEVSCERARQSGECDSGYACAYSSNISWRAPSSPVAAEVSPRLVYDRLFAAGPPGETPAERAERLRGRASVLDLVRGDATRLRGRLGTTDRRKLDEYLDAVREIERRVARLEEGGEPEGAPAPPAPGVPSDYRQHLRLQYDLLALAFRLDLVRVATFMVANEGSDKNYGFVGAPGGHHTLSHHGGDAEKIARIKKINLFHVEEFARFVGSLAGTPEGEGSLLDSCGIVLGSGISDGDAHNHDHLPVLVAGRLGGAVAPGRHLRLKGETPCCNLFLSLLDAMGVKAASFGDSTGRLAGL
ncbi:MAG: DUF1552 domain-containing protein [Planctomycetales bacterium]|nr:DUF1552 domain-containing protein [Planctomycetales bacterium]